MTRAIRHTLLWLRFLPLGVALIVFIAGMSDVHTLKAVADYLAPDGRAEKFSLSVIADVRHRMIIASIGWLILGILSVALVPHVVKLLQSVPSDAQRWTDLFVRVTRAESIHLSLVLLLTVVAAVLAGMHLSQPMRVDEAATFLNYASRPWYFAVSAYNTPNNHILHTLLVNLSCQLFGNQPWAVRLPAYIGGVLLAPAVYLATRVHFGRAVALLTLALYTTSPYALDMYTNGRGYTILGFIFMLLLLILPRVVASRPRAWVAFVILSALGFFTVPVMVLPFGIVCLWLVFAWLTVVPPPRRKRFFVRCTVAMLAVGALTAALYSPAYILTEVAPVLGRFAENAKIESTSEAVFQFTDYLQLLWSYWTFGRLPMEGPLLLAGFVVSVLMSWRVHTHGSRLVLATVLGIGSIIAVTRTLPPIWSMTFSFPLYLGFASAGLIAVAQWVVRAEQLERAVMVTACVVWGLSTGGLVYYSHLSAVPWCVGYPDAQQAALHLQPYLARGVRFDTWNVSSTPIRYYLYLQGDEEPYREKWERKEKPDELILIISNNPEMLRGYEKKIADTGLVQNRVVQTLSESVIVQFVQSGNRTPGGMSDVHPPTENGLVHE